MKCWDCKKEIDAEDNYCRHCGMGQGSCIPFSYRRLGIIAWFLFTGPCAIYFVARTPLLSKTSKIAISVIMTAVFCWFCYGAIKFFCNVMAEVQQLLGTGIPVF